MAGLAHRAGDAGITRLFQGLDVLALGVVGAADELAEAALLDDELAAILRTHPVFDHHQFFLLGRGGRGSFFGGFVEVAGVVAFRVAGAADEAAALAEADVQRLAALGAGFVELLGGDFGAADAFLFLQLLLEALPEAVEHRHPLALAVGDVVKLVFQPGGEVVVDVLFEVLGQELVDDVTGVGRLEAFFLQRDVFAVLQRLDDRGVGGRAADAVFLQCLDEAGFGIARRRLGEVLFAVELVDRQFVADLQHRQAGFVVITGSGVVAVLVFLVDGNEAGEGQHLAAGPEHAVADGDVDGGGIELRRCHLAGQRALPDHGVELELLGRQEGLDRFRGAEDRGRPDGFVRFLGVLRLVLVADRALGQVVGVKVFADVIADFGQRVVGQHHGVGTHVGDQADLALADIDPFVELLRGAHGAVGGHAELAHGFLLQGRGGERCSRTARLLFLFHRRHADRLARQGREDTGLRRFVGDVELVELAAQPVGQAGGEFLPALVAVEVHRPVFAGFKGADFRLAFADQPQGRALHPAGRQAAADFLPQERRELEADQVVERPAGLLGIHQFLQDVARMRHGIQHGILGDFVEHHALDVLVLEQLFRLQDLQQVPRDRFAFAVRVGCEVDVVGLAHCRRDGVNVLGVLGDDLVLHRKVVLGIDSTVLRHQITHVPIRGEYLEVGPEVFFQRFRL